ncbi:MAG: Ig-like domain-containing protein [Anaerolineales bacterium]|nr:Ig-like domain-containing protein [Anaerolineales bacterium]
MESQNNPNRPNTLYNDLAKGGVALFLLLALIFALVRGDGDGTEVASGVPPDGTSSAPAGQGTPAAQLTPGSPGMASPAVGADGSVTFSGIGAPGSTVEIWANGEMVGEVTVSDNGTWVYEISPAPGDYQVVVVTRDAEGNVQDQSAPVGVTVPPAGSGPGGQSPDGGDPSQPPPEIVGANVSESGEVTITGTGQPGSTVVIIEDGIEAASVVVSADGTFTATYQSTPGEHVFELQPGAPPADTATPDGGGSTDSGGSATDGSGSAEQGTPPAPEATAAPAQPTPTRTPIPIPPGGLDYIVQPNEWLVDLARRYYGDASRWVDIYVATNTKATLDSSYAFLSDPNFVQAGWKIFIPEK